MSPPMDAQSQRAAQILAMISRLAQVTEETGAQLALSATIPAPLLDEQISLANTYRFEMQRVQADPSLLRGADPHLIDELIAGGARLRAALDHHQHTISILKTVSEGLAEAMAQEVSRQIAPAASYGAQGAIKLPGQGNPAVAVDRRA